jgi:quercetin dioxygenase-like cupin family protein
MTGRRTASVKTSLTLLVAFLAGAAIAHVAADYRQAESAARVYQSPGGTKLRVLVDESSLKGTEVEIAELTFAPNSDSGDHKHGVTETFYVLEGELEHVVNGQSMKLTPGMVGSVRPPADVRHKTGPAGAKALAIWAPGGEIARVTARWRAQ